MAHHSLPSTSATVHWGFFDAALPPVLTIQSGDVVTIETVSGAPEHLPADRSRVLADHLRIHNEMTPTLGPHIVTGPIAIAGAGPGDTVDIEVLDITFRVDWAWNAHKRGLGALPDEFPDPRVIHIDIDRVRNEAVMPWGQRLGLRPFFGIYAVAPPRERGAVSSVPPDVFGGNMDNKELAEGAVVHLPVFNDGALLSIGDGHGLQGDGEVCLTALETCLTGTLRLSVRHNTGLAAPRATTKTHLITHGFQPDLDDAATMALRDMIEWVVELTGLSRPDVYTLCSLVCDLRVTQLVDGNKGIHAMMPLDAIGSNGGSLLEASEW